MKKLVCIIAFLGLVFNLVAQSQGQFTGALLWKISGQDLKKPSYILGTHHAVDVSFLDSIPGVIQALMQVKQVAGEVDLTDMESTGSIALKYSLMPKEYSYKSLLSEKDYNLLDKALSEQIGMGMSQLQALHPATINTLLVQMICSKLFPEFQNPNFEPIDSYIQKLALNKKKSVIGLETIEEQFELLYNSASIEDQVKSLLCVVRYPEESFDGLAEITGFYRQKQLDKLYEFYQKSSEILDSDDECQTEPFSMEGLNKERNDKWLKTLPQIMKEKSTLVVVGAMHIAGEEGLLYKLAKMGYTVEAVRE